MPNRGPHVIDYTRGLSRRQLLRRGGVAALAATAGPALLSGCGSGAGSATNGVNLEFMYWGSAFEKQAIDDMLSSFNETSESHADSMFTPVADYDTKMSSIVAANTPPDLAYLGGAQLYDFAQNGLILNLYPYFDKYPALTEKLPSSYFWYGEDKLAANQLAQGVQILYYNTEAFTEAGVEPVPFTVDGAWDWDAYVQAADRLTFDDNGRHPSESGYDPGNVAQYGTIAPGGGAPLYALLRSAGADVVSEDGTEFAMDSDVAVSVMQDVQDLVYVHRVAPTPAQLGQNAPTTSVQLQTKRVAMIIDGNWAMLDLLESEVPFGVGVLPSYGEPLTVTGGAAGAIFEATEHPEEAIELYLYYNDPANVDLFKQGLWAPLQTEYYTDQALIDTWVTDAYPANFQSAVVEPTIDHSVTYWDQTLKNASRIGDVVVPAMEQLNSGKVPAREVADGLRTKMEPLLEGRWPSQQL